MNKYMLKIYFKKPDRDSHSPACAFGVTSEGDLVLHASRDSALRISDSISNSLLQKNFNPVGILISTTFNGTLQQFQTPNTVVIFISFFFFINSQSTCLIKILAMHSKRRSSSESLKDSFDVNIYSYQKTQYKI